MTTTSDEQELRRLVTEFRKGILDGDPSAFMCRAVCLPLQSYLSFCGYETTVVDGVINSDDNELFHTWLQWGDLIIDPTADQLSIVGRKMPKVYIGPRPEWYEIINEAAMTTTS